jgi:hypothetical protein
MSTAITATLATSGASYITVQWKNMNTNYYVQKIYTQSTSSVSITDVILNPDEQNLIMGSAGNTFTVSITNDTYSINSASATINTEYGAWNPFTLSISNNNYSINFASATIVVNYELWEPVAQLSGGFETLNNTVDDGFGNATINGALGVTGTTTTGTLTVNGTNPLILYNNGAGSGFPTTTTRSNGTRLVLAQTMDSTHVDAAIGIAPGTFWFSNADTSKSFSWYGGTSNAMTLTGTGNLSIPGTLTVGSQNITGTIAGSGDYSGTATNGQYLAYNSTSSKWNPSTLPAYPSNSSFALSGLSDALITSPSTNQILTWNGTKWVNQAPSVSSTSSSANTFNVTGSAPLISYAGAGTGNPAFNTRSAGTKLVLWPNIDSTHSDYAMGITSGTPNTLWTSVPATSEQFQWYAGTTNIMTLSGTGNLQANGNITYGSNLQSPNAANSTGGVKMDVWGNMQFVGGGSGNQWGIANQAGGSLFVVSAGGTTTVQGNLTVNGTGTSTFAGNVTYGNSLYSPQSQGIHFDGYGNAVFNSGAGSGNDWNIYTTGGSSLFRVNATSGNATVSGNLTANGALVYRFNTVGNSGILGWGFNRITAENGTVYLPTSFIHGGEIIIAAGWANSAPPSKVSVNSSGYRIYSNQSGESNTTFDLFWNASNRLICDNSGTGRTAGNASWYLQ